MLSIFLVFGAIFLFCISGLQAYLFSPQSQTGQKITVVLMMLGAFAGISGVALVIASPDAVSMNIPWTLPWSRFSVKIDHLGCVFQNSWYPRRISRIPDLIPEWSRAPRNIG